MSERLAVAVPVSTLWTSPEAPRDLDAPAVADHPDVPAWLAALDDQEREGLHGRTLSQLLLGEPVDVLETRAGWARVVAPWQPSSDDDQGYPGWLRLAHLAPPSETSDRLAVVTAPVTTLTTDSGAEEPEVSWGTVLPVLAESTQLVRVALPGGGSGSLPSDAIRVRQSGSPEAHDSERVLAGARQFLGLRYLWGGTCGLGLDCSGLVHLAFRVLGVVVARDAHDQQAAAEPVDVAAARPGDLYFFRREGRGIHHVGIVAGRGQMLHASELGGQVSEEPLDADRLGTLCATGRYQDASTPSSLSPQRIACGPR